MIEHDAIKTETSGSKSSVPRWPKQAWIIDTIFNP